jgi:hypothetical protein
MTPFTVHDADGRILRSGICQDEAFDHQAQDGEAVLPIESKDDRHYVDVGSGTLVEFPPQPKPEYVFDYKSKSWVDSRSLADLQDLKWIDIKKARSAVEFSQFTYSGMVFDGDLNAQRRLSTYISVSKSALAAGTPFQAEFILADNTVVVLDAQDFVNIELTKANQVAQAFSKAAELRVKVYAAQTIEELSTINWI